MKKIFLLFALSAAVTTQAQITLDHTYPSGTRVNLDKFPLSGYKYTEVNLQTHKINIYNLNHSLFKSITFPTLPGSTSIAYISETLFDSDSLVEYMLNNQISVSGPPDSIMFKTYIYKENGTQIFFRDSAYLFYALSGNVFNITDPIYFDGTSAKMRLTVQLNSQPGGPGYSEIYNLPGSIPCIQCSTGSLGNISTGLKKNNTDGVQATFYPNPVSDQLKLKYALPKEAKVAMIKITDMQGKLLEEFKVTSSFDYLYLPSNYNNGMYLYSLLVDGQIIKTEKIILNK